MAFFRTVESLLFGVFFLALLFAFLVIGLNAHVLDDDSWLQRCVGLHLLVVGLLLLCLVLLLLLLLLLTLLSLLLLLVD